MNNWTHVLSTSTSLPFDPVGERTLAGSVVSRTSLTAVERDQMYALLATYFVATERPQFDADLAEKESVVLLRDVKTGEIHGFSTFMHIEMSIDEQEVVAFFSGDTIVAHKYWGETILSRLWSRTVFAKADHIRAKRPSTLVYWFLICSGYKTFRFLPVFFREFYPNPEIPTPPDIQHILNTLGETKFGCQYNSASGVIRFRSAAPLRLGVADVTEQRMRDVMVSFFTTMNPGYSKGDELACITEISRSNLTRAGERMVGTPLKHSGSA